MVYGQELILDIGGCNPDAMTRDNIEKYFVELCKRIDMVRRDVHWWQEPPEINETLPPHLKGVSAVQFIETSNITIHALTDLRRVYLNIFSCKPFDPWIAQDCSLEFFEGYVTHHHFVDRD